MTDMTGMADAAEDAARAAFAQHRLYATRRELAPREAALRGSLVASFASGAFFDTLRVHEQLCVGGNGVVLLGGVDVPPGGTETVAVKLVPGVADPLHCATRHRFLNEFHALHAMPPHPCVVPLLLHSVQRLPAPLLSRLPEAARRLMATPDDPALVLVMEHHPTTLESAACALLAPPAALLLRWCIDLAAAVAHLWRQRWVHLDLRAGAAVVTADGHAALTALAAAQRVEADGSLCAALGVGLEGGLAHRAPEVLGEWERAYQQHSPDWGHVVRVDGGRQEVWALGVLLHELVAGSHPYGAEYPGAGRDGAAAVDEAALVARGMPARMVGVLRRMVSRDAAVRPADPNVAYADLVACCLPALQPSQPSQPQPQTSYAASAAPTAAAVAAVATVAAVAAVAVDATIATATPASPSAPQLRDVEQACAGSMLNLGHDPATWRAAPNQWTERLEEWSEGPEAPAAHAAALYLALLLHSALAGLPEDRERAAELAEEALPWCLAAAREGVTLAQRLLASCHSQGIGVPEDKAQALAWYRRAAEQGDAAAQMNMGLCYEHGKGVPCDMVEAVAWYRRAAEQAFAPAQLNLGVCYEYGKGVPRDKAMAVAWYRFAAERGLAQAQLNLSVCYERGHGVAQDWGEAIAWCRRAAEQGHVAAQFSLGARYERGQGVPQQMGKAVAWYHRAAKQGMAEAQAALRSLGQ